MAPPLDGVSRLRSDDTKLVERTACRVAADPVIASGGQVRVALRVLHSALGAVYSNLQHPDFGEPGAYPRPLRLPDRREPSLGLLEVLQPQQAIEIWHESPMGRLGAE
jgi:hypothetical protein